jgi:hypothetical protein
MNVLRAMLLGSCSLLAACGGERALLADASGRYRLMASFTGAEVGSDACHALMRRLGDQALVFAQDAPSAQRLAGSHGATANPPAHGRFVTIGDETSDAAPIDRTALVVAPTGVAVAVDLALLWCHGIVPPRRLALGPRFVLPGGSMTTQPAPSDFVVELLRRQHGDLLTLQPQTDVVFRIGTATLRDDGVQRLVREQATESAKRYPQLVSTTRHAGGDQPALDGIVRDFLAEGARAILIATDDPRSLAAIAAATAERNVALFVLDATAECELGTCCIGCDQHTLGRAAGEAVKLLAPTGASIVELAADLPSAAAQLRHRGFGDALGLLPTK